MSKEISIVIQYLLKNADTWQSIDLTPEEYFDPLTDDEISYCVDSLPKFFNLWHYVDNELSEIFFLKLTISSNDDRLEENYTFWNSGLKIIF